MLNNSEKDKNLGTLVEEIKLDLLSYINSRVRLFKLDTYEKLSISASTIGYGLIILTIINLMIFFGLMGLAFFIGELLNSTAAGFAIMALFSLFVLFIVYLSRDLIKRTILNSILNFFRKLDANDED